MIGANNAIGVTEQGSLPSLMQRLEQPSSLEDLLRKTEGADLLEVVAAVKSANPQWANHILDELTICGQDQAIPQGKSLPLPHPLDAEFRFDETTAVALADFLLEKSSPGDEILIVGAPTVAIELSDRAADRSIRFVGLKDCVTSAVSTAFDNADSFALGPGMGSTATIALVDPPWYDRPVQEMMATVAAGLQLGAHALFVGPRVGTRPTARDDLSRYLDYCQQIGLAASSSDTFEIGYRTPLFEVAALEANCIRPPSTWRYGQASLLRKQRSVEVSPLSGGKGTSADEIVFDGIRLRLVETGASDFQTTSLHEAKVFPSVSRRAPERSQFNLWTTTNRAVAVDAAEVKKAFEEIRKLPYDLLYRFIRSGENSLLEDKALDFSEKATQGVIRLLAIEWQEATRLVGEGSWETRRTEWRSREQ